MRDIEKLGWLSGMLVLVWGAAAQQAVGQASGTFPNEPFNGLQITYSVSGATVTETKDEPGFTTSRSLKGNLGAGQLSVSGSAKATKPACKTEYGSFYTKIHVSVWAGDQKKEYSAPVPDECEKASESYSFSLAVSIPKDAKRGGFLIDETLVNPRFGNRGLVVSGEFEGGKVTPTKEPPGPKPPPPPTAKKPPCNETGFFYDPETLENVYASEPSLNFGREELVMSIIAAIQKYEKEGGKAVEGVRNLDAPFIAQAFDSGALPTGNEALLRVEAMDLAKKKKGKLTPGELFYCALKATNGNVRDALVASHAALYRDKGKVNQQFIDLCLLPIRNPNGYSDKRTVKVWNERLKKDQYVSARETSGNDQQGAWYHLFGMAALEFTDRNGLTPFVLVRKGAEHYKPAQTKALREKGFPMSEVCGQLSNYAVALENEVRTGMRRAPDPDKQCVNYSGAAIGTALAKYMKLPTKRGLLAKAMGIETRRQWRTNMDYVWLMKSPVSLTIEGTQGEKFSFDQEEKLLSGNTDLVHVDPILEEDGTWGLLVAPYFKVQKVQVDGAEEGEAVLAYHDLQRKGSRGYSLHVAKGETYTMTYDGTAAVPELKGGSGTVVRPVVDQISRGQPPPGPAPTGGKAFELPTSATGYRLDSGYAPRNLALDLILNYSRPGTVLDTVGLNAAPIGSFFLRIEEDGRVAFGIYDPGRGSEVRASNGWHTLQSRSRLDPQSDHEVRINVDQQAISLWVHGQQEARLELATPLSGQPIFVGDFPGDDRWGSKYNIHPAMVGRVSVKPGGQPKAPTAAPQPPGPVAQPETPPKPVTPPLAGGWLGVIAETFTTKGGQSQVRVLGVAPESPAKGGLMPRDLLLMADQGAVSSVKQLAALLAGKREGDTMAFQVRRAKKDQTVSVKLGSMPPEGQRLLLVSGEIRGKDYAAKLQAFLDPVHRSGSGLLSGSGVGSLEGAFQGSWDPDTGAVRFEAKGKANLLVKTPFEGLITGQIDRSGNGKGESQASGLLVEERGTWSCQPLVSENVAAL